MSVELRRRPKSIVREIAESPMGWAASTALIFSGYHVARAACGLAEIAMDQYLRFSDGILSKIDEIKLRRMQKLNQEDNYGSKH